MRWTGPSRASCGAYRKMAHAATSMAATEPAVSAYSLRSSVIQHEPGGEGGDHQEEYVEVGQHEERLAPERQPGHRLPPHGDLHRAAADDDEQPPAAPPPTAPPPPPHPP